MPRTTRILVSPLFLALVLLFSVPVYAAPNTERILIRTPKPYTTLVSQIQSLGGKVTYQYKYVDAIAVEVPSSALQAVRSMVGATAISKDESLDAPSPVNELSPRAGYLSTGDENRIMYDSADAIPAADLQLFAAFHPEGYIINNGISNAASLHAAGITGSGVVVAVIDSGIRPGFPHISLDGSVIGCEDFVGDALGCSNSGNNGHGTFVAGMISANVVFSFSAASGFRNAILAYCPACFLNPPTNTQVPMLGSAPSSSIYALRVFPATGGAPSSRILAAVERAMELKEKFDTGQPGGVNVRVVNMSLGGSTVFAGRDLFDTEVNLMLDKGIVFAVAAGNAGPSSLTIGSPGSSFGSLTVGAASFSHNERILRHLQLPAGLGPNRGALYRPFSGTQMAYFSSRGPNADGRTDPDLVANGFANFGQGFGATAGSIDIGSGTSFSTPTVAGIAALLRQAFPSATARQIRNALIMSTNPSLIADGSTELDQGGGYVDALAAFNTLAAGLAPDTLDKPRNPNRKVKTSVKKETDLEVRSGVVSEHIDPLLPGQRHDILFQVSDNARQVIVTLANLTPENAPAQQNLLFGDDILLAIHSAKTSEIGEGDYKTFEFTTGGTFVINNPEPGLMRVTVNGDWTNAGRVSADLFVAESNGALPGVSNVGTLAPSEVQVFPLIVPSGVSVANFRLDWTSDWSTYPTSDLDMILVAPNGSVNGDGATVNSPEQASIQNPAAGTWFIVLDGFEVHRSQEHYHLRVDLDGALIKVK